MESAAGIVERDFLAVTVPFVRLRPDSGLHAKAVALAAHLRALATRSLDESITDELVSLLEVLPYRWASGQYRADATAAHHHTPAWRIAGALLCVIAPAAVAVALPAWSGLFALAGAVGATFALSGNAGLRELAVHWATQRR